MPYAPYTPYMPYVHCLQESDWLMSPPHPIRSMELNNLIIIKSWFFSPPPYAPYAPYMPYVPYAPYAHCLQESDWLMSWFFPPPPYVPYAPYMPYAPYVPSLQDSDWLMSPPHPIRSIELNNLINIKSWFFPHHLFEKSTRSQNRSISWL